MEEEEDEEYQEEEEVFITSGNWRGKHNLLYGPPLYEGCFAPTWYARVSGLNTSLYMPVCHLCFLSAMYIPCHSCTGSKAVHGREAWGCPAKT